MQVISDSGVILQAGDVVKFSFSGFDKLGETECFVLKNCRRDPVFMTPLESNVLQFRTYKSSIVFVRPDDYLERRIMSIEEALLSKNSLIRKWGLKNANKKDPAKDR